MSVADPITEWEESWQRPAREGRLVDAVAEYVRVYDHVTFVELTKRFKSYLEVAGTVAICLPTDPNVIIWAGLSQAFADVLVEALVAKRVHPHPTVWLTYMIDGGTLKLPIVKRATKGGRKKEAWLPVVLRAVSIPEKTARRRRA